MTWHTDDRRLYWEQRRLDAAQEDARRKMEERKTAPAMTPEQIARGLTKALSRPKVRRAINDIRASEYGWCKRSDGVYHNLMGSRYMQYDPRLRRIMRVHGWGESFQVWPWEHWAIMLAVRAELERNSHD